MTRVGEGSVRMSMRGFLITLLIMMLVMNHTILHAHVQAVFDRFERVECGMKIFISSGCVEGD